MTTPHFDLSGRAAVITGGARGVGLDTALRFARAGADLAIVDRDQQATAAATAAIEAAGGRAIGCAIDITDDRAVDDMTRQVMAAYGRYDILVCAAGIVGRNAFAWETSADEWRQVLDINLTGLWLCNRAALGPMRQANRGRIVNIASIAGKEGNPKLGPYSASKAGVIGMTKSLAKEVADTEIRINSIAPAVIQTPMLDQVSPETIAYMVSKIPVGRTGRTEEVAALIHYLASDECGFATGACFDISGGRATY
ncbi:MAG: SDR family oxidoreductase [Planctomycetes bacterium]|nr:SDR family oxidoreductase [Planctomycetota bacterium]